MRQNLAYHMSVMQAVRAKAYKLVGLQLIVITVVALCWGFAGVRSTTSALLGGLACILPNFYFAYRFFTSFDSKNVKKILKTFYWGELIKLLLSASLVAIVLSTIKVNILPFFTGFVGAHLGYWLAPLTAVINEVAVNK